MSSENLEDKAFCNLINCLNMFNRSVIIGPRGNRSGYQQYFRNLRLLLAADSKNVCIHKLYTLLKDGSDINHVDCSKNTVLHRAVKNPKATFEIILFLLESGADPDARNNNNQPPLAYCNPLTTAKLLIQHTVVKQNTLIENYDSKNECDVSIEEAEKFLNLSFCKNKDIHTVFTHYRNSCIAEMKLMQKDKISEDYTFFDFIICNYIKCRPIKGNINVDMSAIEEILLRLYNNKYPSCRDIIYSSIRHTTVNLTKSFNVQPYTVNPAEKVILLNTECTTELENYLTTEDTINLIEAFGHNSMFEEKLFSTERLGEEDEQSLENNN